MFKLLTLDFKYQFYLDLYQCLPSHSSADDLISPSHLTPRMLTHTQLFRPD